MSRTLVIVPTYCERDVIAATLSAVRRTVKDADVLVVDDGSPDGTAEVVASLARADSRIHLLQRGSKDGLGRAYMAGFTWALERGFDRIVEMDADGSHRAEHLADILAALEAADLVVGSRWVRGGSTVGWSLSRRLVSRAGNLYARTMLGIPVRDATSGFRAFDARALRLCLPATEASQGYAFQVEMVWRFHRRGLRIAEVPIVFHERESGESKMTLGIAAEAAIGILRWRMSRT